MLDAHPHLAIPAQTHFVPLAARNCKIAVDPRRAFVETLTSHPLWPNFHVADHMLEEKVADIDPFDVGEALRTFYRTYAENFGKPRWGDKTPGYVYQMKRIQELLPEARFIHMIRDGRAVALSLNEAWRSSGRAKTPEQAATWWMSRITKARRQAIRLSYYLEIRYEDLVTSTETTLRRVCEFLELSWNPLMLEYYKTAAARISEIVVLDREKAATIEEQVSRHAWTSKPPEAARIDRWKREMSASDLLEFERVAGGMLAELGYDRVA